MDQLLEIKSSGPVIGTVGIQATVTPDGMETKSAVSEAMAEARRVNAAKAAKAAADVVLADQISIILAETGKPARATDIRKLLQKKRIIAVKADINRVLYHSGRFVKIKTGAQCPVWLRLEEGAGTGAGAGAGTGAGAGAGAGEGAQS